ncbi:VCBS repeat-containing protein, partial [Candidatus Sumerlaeota bacterium]|nr:VCBS repeat-containing protein [Candidatus Sumerlaeota bacterium]
MNRKDYLSTITFTAALIALLFLSLAIPAAAPGIPFTEDFAARDLCDTAQTTAHWSSEEQALILSWRRTRFAALAPGNVSGSDITSDAQASHSMALGDMDGDGDLDLVVGNSNQANRLYLNNGTSNPFGGVTGSNITGDAHNTEMIAVGDMDGDGDLDIVAANEGQINRLYLNNGTSSPFNGVTGSNITGDTHDTRGLALGDVDGDGDLDIVTGNVSNQRNRLYLNNGTTAPFSGVTGSDITTDGQWTLAVALADMDGDGDLDVVAGNDGQANRLYLSNGTADPFNGISGSNISGDTHGTWSVALGDVDNDGDIDVIVGNTLGQRSRLYLNNGTATPFSGVSGSDISTDTYTTFSAELGDIDGDGDLDFIAGNDNQRNRLYLNNGSANPFSGVSGTDITTDSHALRRGALGDMDGDGDLDYVVVNRNQVNRLYLNAAGESPFTAVGGSDITADAHDTPSVALGDLDGDGDIDLVAGNYNNSGQRIRLYLNNGTSNPFNGVTGSDISTDSHPTRAVALGDVDRDGDLDLVAGNGSYRNRLYLNNGTGNPFGGVPGLDITTYTADTRAVALGDLDGDGDLDLVAGNRNT